TGGNPAITASQYDPVIIGSTGVISEAYIGVMGSGQASVTVLGTVDAHGIAVQLNGSSNYLRIGAFGVLNNDTNFGAWLGSDNDSVNNTVINEGYIQTASVGILVQGSGTRISNSGEIRSRSVEVINLESHPG
ncbi:hypothetical protein, partial [Myxococcus sp. CA039A]|uniref:hypothetical protein n=1 Tax=Myxococcus sp. CA039A TaxID=2741737 RepID=UPI001C2D49BA